MQEDCEGHRISWNYILQNCFWSDMSAMGPRHPTWHIPEWYTLWNGKHGTGRYEMLSLSETKEHMTIYIDIFCLLVTQHFCCHEGQRLHIVFFRNLPKQKLHKLHLTHKLEFCASSCCILSSQEPDKMQDKSFVYFLGILVKLPCFQSIFFHTHGFTRQLPKNKWLDVIPAKATAIHLPVWVNDVCFQWTTAETLTTNLMDPGATLWIPTEDGSTVLFHCAQVLKYPTKQLVHSSKVEAEYAGHALCEVSSVLISIQWCGQKFPSGKIQFSKLKVTKYFPSPFAPQCDLCLNLLVESHFAFQKSQRGMMAAHADVGITWEDCWWLELLDSFFCWWWFVLWRGEQFSGEKPVNTNQFKISQFPETNFQSVSFVFWQPCLFVCSCGRDQHSNTLIPYPS